MSSIIHPFASVRSSRDARVLLLSEAACSVRKLSCLTSLLVLLAIAPAPAAEEITLAAAPPVVVRTVPVAGAEGVDPSLTELRVTYSKPMQAGSYSWSTWGEENFPETTGKPQDVDERTCVLPVKLQPGRFYATWLNSDKFKGFKDTDGRAAVPYLLTFRTAGPADAKPASQSQSSPAAKSHFDTVLPILNDQQRQVLAWTDRQFRGFFDNRTFEGWSEQDRAALESRLLEALAGPHNQEYYRAINSLGALRASKAFQPLKTIATERTEKDNRDRWMAIRALAILGNQAIVPDLIPLVYHGNVNTRWWAQISLVSLTGKNLGNDWQAWGKWWAEQGGQPPFNPEFVVWYRDPDLSDPSKLPQTLAERDQKFLEQISAKTK